MPSDRRLDKIVNKENRHYDNVIKDLFRSPHVIARIIQTAIPEFFDWSIEDIINILPTEGKQVHFDMQSSSDSDYKSVIGDLKFTIEKVESIKNIKNGAKIGLEVQTSKLTSFADKARKNQYIAQQISEQQVDYKKLKESYLIWIFINPRHHFKDKILFSDFSSVRYEGHIRDGEIEFELVDKEKYKPVLNKNEFLDIRTDSLMHEVEIYISENNTSNLDLFQFLRELALNTHDRNEAIQTFNEFGWNLSEKEANLVEEVMSFSDILLANYEDKLKTKVRKEIEEEYVIREKQLREENTVKEKQVIEEFDAKEKQLKKENAESIKQLKEENAESIKQLKEENAASIKQLKEENAAREKQLREFYEQKMKEMELKNSN